MLHLILAFLVFQTTSCGAECKGYIDADGKCVEIEEGIETDSFEGGLPNYPSEEVEEPDDEEESTCS